MKSLGYCIRRYRPGDEEAVTELMNRAFGFERGSGPWLTPGWWRWKYLGNPAGYHSLVAEGPEGALVGHYGGVPLEVIADGEPVQFGQNCDSCSDPAVRRGLKNPGLFVRLAQAYASTFARPGEDAVMYGLPNREVFRVGARYLDYWMLRTQLALVIRDSGTLPAGDAATVEEVPAFPPELDPTLAELGGRFRCMGRRSKRFLDWRFRDHPDVDYDMAVARPRGEGRPTGYAVYREATLWGRDIGILMDFHADPEDHPTCLALLRWAADRASSGGRRALMFFCATSSPWFVLLQGWGFAVEPTQYTMTARPYDGRLEPAFLREHWNYTLADFDIL